MTNHFVYEARVPPTHDVLRQPVLQFVATTYSSPTLIRRDSIRVRHAIAHVFPEGETKRGQSIVRLVRAGKNAGPASRRATNIWRSVCACASETSVPDVTPTTVHFARCGVRCAAPRSTARRRPNCDIRRTHDESLATPRRNERRRTGSQYCDSVPSARARRSAYVMASEPIVRNAKQNTASVPTSAKTARNGAPSIVTCRTARNP